MPQYQEKWPVGARVRIANSAALEKFAREWRYHNKLRVEQLAYAGRETQVKSVGFYHGGDPLYVLEHVPGIWHEECLQTAD